MQNGKPTAEDIAINAITYRATTKVRIEGLKNGVKATGLEPSLTKRRRGGLLESPLRFFPVNVGHEFFDVIRFAILIIDIKSMLISVYNNNRLCHP